MYPPLWNLNDIIKLENISNSPKLIINDDLSERSESALSEKHYNQQAQGNIIARPKFIINDELSQRSKSSQSKYYKSSPPLLNQQPYQQYNYPQQQQQHEQPLLEQTTKSNTQLNQVSCNIVQLNDHNNGLNRGINKIFGCSVTLIWSIITIIDYLLMFYAINYEIQAYSSDDIYITIGCLGLMLLISLIVYIVKIPNKVSKCASGFLFFIYMASSIETSQGFLYLFHNIQVLYFIYCFFQIAQFETMISAFFYLLCSKNKPQAKYLITIQIVFSILFSPCKYWLFENLIDQQQGLLIYLQVDIWICLIFCPILIVRLVKILEPLYMGTNKKIQRDNICKGFILFKLYFFIPGI